MKAAEHPLYRTYSNMKTRCYNPKNVAYKNYGGRGIKVCDRWLKSFWMFLVDMGEKPSPKHSLERIDNHGCYSKENCRWATPEEQANNMRPNVLLTHDGQTMTAAQWAKKTGINVATICARVHDFGLSHEEALTRPLRAHNELSADNLRHGNAKPVTFNGETHTLSEWARRLGVKTTTISRRVARLGVERALGEPIEPYRPKSGYEAVGHKSAKPVTFAGETHTTSGWAAKLGIPYATMKWRLKNWGPEKSLSHVVPTGSAS